MIRWKIVDKNNRGSAIVGSNDVPTRLTYKKDTIVESPPQEPGIMVFKTLEHAKKWHKPIEHHTIIVKVRAIGKGRKPKWLCSLSVFTSFEKRWLNMVFSSKNKEKFNNKTRYHSWDVPEGTLCYRSVEVLE